MNNGSGGLFADRASDGKIRAYYRKLLADSSTSPLMRELAKSNLAKLDGQAYSVDWERLNRIYVVEHPLPARPPLSEVMDKPDSDQQLLPPETQQPKEKAGPEPKEKADATKAADEGEKQDWPF